MLNFTRKLQLYYKYIKNAWKCIFFYVFVTFCNSFWYNKYNCNCTVYKRERGYLNMGTYNIPRNVQGEGRILFVFSTKSLIYSSIGLLLGLPFYFIFSSLKMTLIGIIFVAFLALIGFPPSLDKSTL